MRVTARICLNCAKTVRNQTQKTTYHVISCQWISGKGTAIHTEEYLWLQGYRSGGRNLMAKSPREHF